MVIGAFSLWDLIVSVFWFFILFAWIWLVITVFIDIFRDKELSGWSKALWVIFVLILPWLGVLVYLIARGDKMTQNRIDAAQERDQAMRRYVQDASGSTSPAEEIEIASKLLEEGKISQEDFDKIKAKALGST